MSRPVLIFGLLSLTAALAIAATSPPPLTVAGADWKARADAWFGEAKDEKARRKAMRSFTKALKRPCKYCHTTDFKGWQDEQLRLLSQQMMAISVEHGVECKDCHKGRTGFTEFGEKAQPMWQIARDKGVGCEHCHVPKKRFAELTPEGLKFQDSLKKKQQK